MDRRKLLTSRKARMIMIAGRSLAERFGRMNPKGGEGR